MTRELVKDAMPGRAVPTRAVHMKSDNVAIRIQGDAHVLHACNQMAFERCICDCKATVNVAIDARRRGG